MKIVKAENSINVQVTKKEWFEIAAKAGWIKPMPAPASLEKSADKKKKRRYWVGYDSYNGYWHSHDDGHHDHDNDNDNNDTPDADDNDNEDSGSDDGDSGSSDGGDGGGGGE